MSNVSDFHVKDVMDMDLDELIQKYNRTVFAAGLLRYMLEADHGVTEEPEQKTWSLVRQSELQEFQAWKRHKVWCFLRYAHDTHCLFDCPWRPPCFFCAFQTFRVPSLVLAPGTKTVFTAFDMYSMLQAMPPQPPPVPQYPPQHAPQYPPPRGYPPYGQRHEQQEPHAPWDREEGPWDYPMKTEADFEDWSGSPEWDRDPVPLPQQYAQPPPQHQYPPSQPHHQEAPPPEGQDPLIKEEENTAAGEEPKKDESAIHDPTGDPGHRCVQNVCRVFHAFSASSLLVSPGAIVSCAKRSANFARCPSVCPW